MELVSLEYKCLETQSALYKKLCQKVRISIIVSSNQWSLRHALWSKVCSIIRLLIEWMTLWRQPVH